jgi:hypothetical protein
MRNLKDFAISALCLAALAGLSAAPAAAKCTRLGFSVNDYGKDGPTHDAKELLDKYIAKWAGEQNIKKYTVGKKDVNCQLFLNFVVFDEHTCRAEATVCYGGSEGPVTQDANTAPKPVDKAKPADKAEKADKDDKAPAKAIAPVATPKPARSAAKTAPVETGALPDAQLKPTGKPAGDADRAAAAAERAAAAAERAALAAEKAAAVAVEAASPPGIPSPAAPAAAAPALAAGAIAPAAAIAPARP